jgi:hypothetical protein
VEGPFNPYVEWLGIAGARKRPNHYALLGLRKFESDVATIKAAAKLRILSMQKTAAGDREALRAQLLHELAEAARTLTDPLQKQRYDDRLRQQAGLPKPEQSSASNQRSAQAPQPPRGSNLLPPTASSGAKPAALYPSTAAVDPMTPVTAPVNEPLASDFEGEDEEMLPRAVRAATAATAHQPTNAAAPATPAAVQSAVPLARDSGAPANVSADLAKARTAARQLALRRRRAQQWTVGGLLILMLLVATGLGIGYASGLIRIGSSAENTIASSQDGESSPDVSPADNGDAQEVKTADAGQVRTHESPRPTEQVDGSGSKDLAESKAQEKSKRPARRKTKQPPRERVLAVRPADDPPETTEEPPLDPEQVTKFRGVLTAARTALGERQMDAANWHITEAESLAASAQQKRHVSSLKALQTHVEAFWKAVGEGMKGLEDAGELQVGSTIVSVVEANENRLIIRVNGQNRRYDANQLPAGLAAAIAKKWFDDRPDNKLALGAFYFVDPRTDIADAKRLWDEAAAEGVNVNGLLALIDAVNNAPAATDSPNVKK